MRTPPHHLLAPAVAALLAGSARADLFWNPAPLAGDWADTAWSSTSGGSPSLTWTAGENAIFDQSGTYTVSAAAPQSAGVLRVAAGDVTLTGSLVSSNSVVVDAGASLSADANTYLKSGTTTLTVNGTLYNTAAPASTNQRIAIAGGTGSIVLSGNFRTGGNITFAGDISGTGAILTQAGGTFTLGGNNTYSGDTLLRNGNTVRLDSATALSANSLVRFGGGVNIVELRAANLSRTLGTNIRFHNGSDGAGESGFAAVNADRSVDLGSSAQWGGTNFNPTIFHLGTAASTHKVTLTSGLNLNGGNRTINTANGTAAIEAEISGAITGGTGSILTKTGTGVLLLSSANSHAGGTVIAQSQGAVNALRISHSSALGTGPLTIGAGGNNDQSRLELTGGIAVTNSIAALTSRNNDAASFVNVSGNNSISANLSVGGGGSRNSILSDSGTITFTGSISARQLNLQGAGNGVLQGNTTIATGSNLVKTGTGTWTVNAGNLNGGSALVSAGTLYLNGALSNANASAATGGTVGGTGSISGALNVAADGFFAPGNSIGTFSAGSADIAGTWQIEYGNSSIDLFNVTGLLDLDGATLSFSPFAGSLDGTSTYVFATYGSLTGTFSGVAPSGYAIDSAYAGGTAMALVPVPEPGAAALVLLGAGMAFRRRR
jgi:autotransporter-associated beta strand protein